MCECLFNVILFNICLCIIIIVNPVVEDLIGHVAFHSFVSFINIKSVKNTKIVSFMIYYSILISIVQIHLYLPSALF